MAGEADIQGGLSCPLSLYLSPPLSLREADTSLHSFDQSQKGGKNRGVEKKEGEGRMSSRRTSKCSPADLLEEPEGTQLAHAAATHLLLVETYEHLSESLLLSAVHRRINTLGRWVS